MYCHFNLYRVKYPGQILLEPNTEFQFLNDETIVICKVVNHFKPISITDFSRQLGDINKLDYKIDKESVEIESAGFKFIKNERFGAVNIIEDSWYTEIEFRYSCNSHNHFEKEEKIKKVISQFIKSYRNSCGDPTIQNSYENHSKKILIHEYTRKYLETEHNLKEIDRLKSILNHGFQSKELKYLSYGNYINNFNHDHIDKLENTKLLEEFLKEEKKKNLIEIDLLLKAKEELLINKNYKYAFLDSFIFIEQITSQFITYKYKEFGISNNKIKEFEKETGISYMINILLPLIFGGATKLEKELLHELSRINSKRNRVVHKAEDVDESDTNKCIEKAIELYEVIKKKYDD